MASQQPEPHEVFISYAGSDRQLAAALADALAAHGVGAWWDGHLGSDEPFERQIQRVLSDARLIVALLSPHTLDSEWVRWELSQATQNGLHLLALLAHGTRAEVLPPPLHLIPRLTVAGDSGPQLSDAALQIRDLVAALARAPNRPREDDARRRLASAAAAIARQAVDIKLRRTGALPEPRIVVGSPGRHMSQEEPNRFTTSDGFVEFLEEQRTALAFTSFQTGELILVGHRPETGQLTIDIQPFRKPTGVSAGGGGLVLATLAHVFRLENILHSGQRLDGTFTHCYVPRVSHVTGVLDTHDLALTSGNQPVLVATRYNCLATVSAVHSFKPLWRPSFISALVGEDRCHLNGLAVRDGSPAFVTAFACSDTYDGWRARLNDGGVVIDVNTDAVVCEGLSMPHSPRIHDGRLWLINSGSGHLGFLDNATSGGQFVPVAAVPGFARGLALQGRHAAIAVSMPRDDRPTGLTFERALTRGGQVWCGIQFVDISTGECVHWLRIEGEIRELYDVTFLPGVTCPRSVSPLSDDAFDLITLEH